MLISTKRLYKSQTSNLKPFLYSAQWTFHQQFASLQRNVDVHSLYWQLMHFTDWLCIIQYIFSYISTYEMLWNPPTVIKMSKAQLQSFLYCITNEKMLKRRVELLL